MAGAVSAPIVTAMIAALPLALSIETRIWPLVEPFAISRGVETEAETVEVTLIDASGRRGRGEACGVAYEGETPNTLVAQLRAVRREVEAGADRADLLHLLPAGGARCALDAALWDLEAKQGSGDPFERCGLPAGSVATARTIGIRSLTAYAETAGRLADWRVLKIKVDAREPLAAVSAVRRAAPKARLIVDPNQAWSLDMLKALAPSMADLGVDLLEQPIPVGDAAGLDHYVCPVPLCADELVSDLADLPHAFRRFQAINIKLDKSGGLTAALELADRATEMGFRLMVGCMGGSSLGMAPAMVLAQRCAFVDLDGPLLQTGDHVPGFHYDSGTVHRPLLPDLWG